MRIFPGFITPVEVFVMIQKRVVPEPFCTLEGFDERTHEGGSTGGGDGTTLGLAVTEALHFHDPAALFVVMVYCVVASDGGMID